jgi:hypothetical protein
MEHEHLLTKRYETLKRKDSRTGEVYYILFFGIPADEIPQEVIDFAIAEGFKVRFTATEADIDPKPSFKIAGFAKTRGQLYPWDKYVGRIGQ